MKIIVQKYGGSSVATDEKLRHVAQRLLKLHRSGHDVVAVVSAMGDTTNHLLDLAQGLNHSPPGRELDLLLSSGERISSSLLAMAIRAEGVDAVALTGAQAGIRTSARHLSARILEVDAARVRRELAAGRIVVVAGFQGVSRAGEITTLGRGGSDTTAVALAAALTAASCDICSDVDGIYSADPRVVNGALRLPSLHYDEMEALARHGAKVLDLRAVAYAKQHGVTIHACSSFNDNKGTLVCGERHARARVIGVAGLTRLIRFQFGTADTRLAERIIGLCGSEHVYHDATPDGGTDLLISTLNLPDHTQFCERIEHDLGACVKQARDVGSASIIGSGVGRSTESAAHLRTTLDAATDRLQGMFSSTDTRTCIVDKRSVPDAVRALHRRFVERQSHMAAVA